MSRNFALVLSVAAFLGVACGNLVAAEDSVSAGNLSIQDVAERAVRAAAEKAAKDEAAEHGLLERVKAV